MSKQTNKPGMYAGKEGWSAKWVYVIAAVSFIIALITIAKVTPAGGHLLEWLNLVVRWFHVIIGIGWIGASFYFIWLENNLVREGVPENLTGNLYSAHGGGFYYVEKYKAGPPELPETLHWFQWEAYLTWISGVCLLAIVYYANADFMMTNTALVLPGFVTVLIGLTTLVVGWLVYDRLCRSSLVRNGPLFSLVGLGLVTLLALFLSQVMSGRAAYMHVGAMLGTLMAANVFFVIIPAQRIMVNSVVNNEVLDTRYGKNAGLRSLHNNYMTLPVIFIMISNHYPTTFGNAYNWAVLAFLFLASAGVRHYLNLHERGRQANWILPAASLIVLSLALVTAPQMQSMAARADAMAADPVAFSDVERIINERCVSCHATNPTDDVFVSAPKGILLDNREHIKAQADAIYQNAVLSTYMPLGNKTRMTDEERERLGVWVQQGAPISP